MRKIFLIPFILFACNKDNDTTPTPTPDVVETIVGHILTIEHEGDLTLTINDTIQENIDKSYNLSKGDSIKLISNGTQTRLNTNGQIIGYNYPHVSIKIYVDSVLYFEQNCYCPINYTKTIE